MKHSPEQQARQQTATEWYVRLQNPQLPPSERIAFRRWLDSEPLNSEAFHEVEVLWKKLHAPAQQLAHSGWYRPSRHAARMRGLRRPALALACSLLLVIGIGVWRDPGLLQRAGADYASAPGEQQTLTLADGSHVLLDADSALDIDFRADQREVHLRRGRAWFDVSHDAQRPFVVHGQHMSTRVLGTAFAVDRSGREEQVTVSRGRVEVRDEASGQTLTLAPDQQARRHEGHLQGPLSVDSTRTLAWQNGLLLFDRATVGEVVNNLQRMGFPPVVILDENLRQQRLSGTFRSDDPQTLLDALTSSMRLKTTRIPGLAVLIHR